jgi:hypothetical protein
MTGVETKAQGAIASAQDLSVAVRINLMQLLAHRMKMCPL